MALVGIGEWRPDVADYQGTTTRTISNVLPQGDGYGPAKALQVYSAALGAQCRGAYYARKTDGTIQVFAATSTRLYKLDNTALTWTDVSKGATDYSTLPATDNWQFTQFSDYLIAVQANSVPQFISISGGTAFGDLAGSPPTARYVTVVGRFVVLSGLTSNPNRVQWSDLDSAITWTASVGFANFVDFPDGGVVRGVGGGEFGLIAQESAVRTMTYVPGAKPAFQLERIAADAGLLGPYSLITAGGRVFFYSQTGFKMFQVGTGLIPIGKERVDRTFSADLSTANLQLLVGSQDPASTRVYFAYKSVNGTANAFDKIIVYDYGLDRWSTMSVTGEYIASMTKPGVTLEGLDSISGSIDALTFSLDTVSSAVLSSLSAFDGTHKLGFFTGSNLEAVAETPEQNLGGTQRVIVDALMPITDAPTVYGSLKLRSIQGAASTQTAESAMDTNGVCWQGYDTRYARARLRIPAGTTWTFVTGAEPVARPTGQA